MWQGSLKLVCMLANLSPVMSKNLLDTESNDLLDVESMHFLDMSGEGSQGSTYTVLVGLPSRGWNFQGAGLSMKIIWAAQSVHVYDGTENSCKR